MRVSICQSLCLPVCGCPAGHRLRRRLVLVVLQPCRLRFAGPDHPRRLQHGLPDQRSRGRGVPEERAGHPRHGWHLGHRRRLPEVLPRRDRHQRRLSSDQRHRDRRLRQERRRLRRTASRLRRHRHCREPEGVVDQRHHGRRVEDVVGAGSPGQGHALEPGARRLAGPRDPPVRRRRRLGHLRLLHRGHHRQGQGQPRRLHLERRRQRPGAGRQQ